ncbi:NAD-dependent epimerase/dehydratase family protein [Armatimonas rosea]|uniref:Nucleoside-diphosphate-sugar epimerase n=1 Tax=Armatimonas rosea TaxID=685828 RepID=A0A7W9W7I1_ARMRO|nr:NAD(P)-dependent oxidoreductase [Armatimonas rosea]MBB6052489.1 nucleoside-diphosphate-sugar epimerase [Armatimonas rosea]
MKPKLLVIGGSGHVGGLILPFLAEQYTLTVFDLKEPTLGHWVPGDVRDFDALKAAGQGCAKLLYMAMGNHDGSTHPTAQFDVNVTGLYLALRAAQAAGITHAALTSSMSVYEQLGQRFFWDEDAEPDAHHHYGLTKRLGEEVARSAWRQWGISVNALRLCLPVTEETWQSLAQEGRQDIHTEASDVARAILAALEYAFGGYQAFMISGDWQEKRMNMSKAKAMLGWEPLMRDDKQP